MATRDIEWAYTVKGTTAPQKAVLLALAHCMNGRTGKCFPSQQEIAGMTNLGLATVRRALGDLVVGKLIGRTKTAKGRYRSNDEYTLNHDNRAVLAPSTAQSEHRSQNPKAVLSQSKSGAQSERAVEPTGIQQEVNKEVMPTATFGFPDFWIVWPRKDSKKSAQAAWSKATRVATSDVIYEAARLYALHPHRAAKQFVPYAATWLNGERWNDPLPDAPEADHRKQTPEDRARATLRLADTYSDPKEIAS